MALVLFSIGTNLGNRENNIREAIICLEKSLGSSPVAVSPVINTEAEGFDGPDFLNCIASFETEEDPFALLKKIKEIERFIGRTDVPEYDEFGRRIYHDRVIDIDILTYGKIEIDTPDLKIPHPQVESRGYIKELLLNLRADKETQKE